MDVTRLCLCRAPARVGRGAAGSPAVADSRGRQPRVPGPAVSGGQLHQERAALVPRLAHRRRRPLGVSVRRTSRTPCTHTQWPAYLQHLPPPLLGGAGVARSAHLWGVASWPRGLAQASRLRAACISLPLPPYAHSPTVLPAGTWGTSGPAYWAGRRPWSRLPTGSARRSFGVRWPCACRAWCPQRPRSRGRWALRRS